MKAPLGAALSHDGVKVVEVFAFAIRSAPVPVGVPHLNEV